MQMHSGVDLTTYQSDLVKLHPELKAMHSDPTGGKDTEVWNRSWIVYKPSPYKAVQTYYYAEEFIVVNTIDEDNPFFLTL